MERDACGGIDAGGGLHQGKVSEQGRVRAGLPGQVQQIRSVREVVLHLVEENVEKVVHEVVVHTGRIAELRPV